MSSQTNVTLLHRIVSLVGAAFLYVVGKTSFIRKWDHPSFLKIRRLREKVIYAFWHNAQVFLAYAHHGEGASVVVSRSKDGEYIAQVMKKMGLNPIRGSSSRGGDKAMRDFLERLEKGEQIGISPDGPRGPAQTIHNGIVFAAKKSGAPVVAVGLHCQRKIEFNSWDRFILPLPLGRVVVSHSQPFFLSDTIDDEQAKTQVRNALNKEKDRCQQVAKRDLKWTMSFLVEGLHWCYIVLGTLLLPVWSPLLILKYGWRRSWKSVSDRLGRCVPPSSSNQRLWMHAASVGEWQALRPLVSELKQAGHFDLVLTVSTPEAKKIIEKEQPGLFVSLLPIDLPFILNPWIKKVNPSCVLIVETEIWPTLVRSLSKLDIPLFMVNGRLSERSVRRWTWVKPLIQDVLSRFSGFLTRSELDAERFLKLGAAKDRVTVTGNMKSDNLTLHSPENKPDMRESLFGFKDGHVIVGGSTWPGEEEALVKAFETAKKGEVRLILAPRRLERIRDVTQMLGRQPRAWSLWSKVKKAHIWATDILVVDTLGDLKQLYQTGDIAFIGGTLTPKGGQNPLEPASCGLALVHGPSMENFLQEAAILKEMGASQEVQTENELGLVIQNLIQSDHLRTTHGQAALNAVQKQKGATKRTYNHLMDQLGLN